MFSHTHKHTHSARMCTHTAQTPRPSEGPRPARYSAARFFWLHQMNSFLSPFHSWKPYGEDPAECKLSLKRPLNIWIVLWPIYLRGQTELPRTHWDYDKHSQAGFLKGSKHQMPRIPLYLGRDDCSEKLPLSLLNSSSMLLRAVNLDVQ